MAPQIIQKSASEPRARPGPSREPFGRHFGLILASIRSLRGLMFELFRGARLLLLACCLSIAGALFLLRPLLRCSPSELPGYEAQVTKAIASWPRSIMPSFFWGSAAGGRSPLDYWNMSTMFVSCFAFPPLFGTTTTAAATTTTTTTTTTTNTNTNTNQPTNKQTNIL